MKDVIFLHLCQSLVLLLFFILATVTGVVLVSISLVLGGMEWNTFFWAYWSCVLSSVVKRLFMSSAYFLIGFFFLFF